MQNKLGKTTRWFAFFSMAVLCCAAFFASSTSSQKKKPAVEVSATTTTIVLPCPPGRRSQSGSCPTTPTSAVGLSATAKNFHKSVRFEYFVTGGRVVSSAAEGTWDISGLGPGTYTATVEARDNKKHVAVASISLTIADCPDCITDVLCPSLTLNCPDNVTQGSGATFSIQVKGDGHIKRTYNWTVSAGTITQGQGTPSITVNTAGLRGQTITATIDVGGGFGPECQTATSCTIQIQ